MIAFVPRRKPARVAAPSLRLLPLFPLDNAALRKTLRAGLAPAAIGLGMTLPAFAQTPPESEPVAPEEIVVETHPFRRTTEDLVRPVDVLAGEALERARNGTIGDILAERPGVSNASFGPGVGRPVIRGQGGPRVQVLDNGIASMDASAISADHAVTVDPLGAERVEIIKGPATLIYGGAASAGVVNLVDDSLPTTVTPGLRLRGLGTYGDNADEMTAALRARYGSGSLQWGAEYSYRDAGDFSVPGYPVRQHAGDEEAHEHEHEDEHEEEEAPSFNVLDNSSLRAENYGASAAYVGARGMFGVALSRFETQYGIPGGGHSHEHEHEHEEGEEEEEEEGHSHEGVRIDLEQTRVDLRGLLRHPLPGFEAFETRIGINDYQHQEIESSGEIGTTFDVSETEARLQLTHAPVAQWHGVTGVQLSHRDFEAVGEEAFVPPTTTKGAGLFLVEDRPIGAHRLELGARVDHVAHSPDSTGVSDQDYTTYSLSAGMAFVLAEHLHLRLNAQHTQRAPSTEEIYAFGPHLATSSFERGNTQLDPETANNVEIAFERDEGRFRWGASVYYNQISDYIYLRETDLGLNADGSGTADSDGEADRVDEAGQFDPDGELLLVDHRQDDANFYGAEITAAYALLASGPLRLDLEAFGDVVRGELDDGSHLPRIPPMRGGIGLDVRYAAWTGSLRYLRADEQTRTTALETPTPGYDLVSADLGYQLQLGELSATLFLRGRNLLDEKQRLSTSFLKDVAPLPGRSVFAGIRFDLEPSR